MIRKPRDLIEYGKNKREEMKATQSEIKDIWTKSRERVEVGEGGRFSWGGVEGWGEKAYNSNGITIKFF